MKTSTIGFGLVVVALATYPADANIRGPERVRHLPSSALHGLTAELVVHGEDLAFMCQQDSCRVTAQYSIAASDDVQVSLDFILPNQPIGEVVKVQAGGKAADAKTEPAALNAGEREQIPRIHSFEPLIRARFDLELHRGRNQVSVAYLQPLGVDEVDFGYFTKGKMIKRWDYEIWPVLEWKRAPDFAINVAVSVPRSPPTRWQRWFGKVDSVSCGYFGENRDPSQTPSWQQIGQQLQYRFKVKGTIPTRLECGWGDEKHLTRYD
jgi:hypothetical protein